MNIKSTFGVNGLNTLMKQPLLFFIVQKVEKNNFVLKKLSHFGFIFATDHLTNF